MSTEVSVREGFLPTPTEWEMATQMADVLIQTAFVPKGLRDGGPGAVLACILAGKELGLGPMTAIREIDVIQGSPSPSGQLLAALARRHGHKIEFVEYTESAVTVRGTRCDDGTSLEVRWTMDDAVKAGLADKQVWKQYPRSMLLWRCLSELNRALFSGESLGVGKYTGEEMGRDELPGPTDAIVEVDGHSVDAHTGEIVVEAIVTGSAPSNAPLAEEPGAVQGAAEVETAAVAGDDSPAAPPSQQATLDTYVPEEPGPDDIPFESTAPPIIEPDGEVVYEPAQMARAALIRRTLGVMVSHGVPVTEEVIFDRIAKLASDGRSVFYGFGGTEFEDLSESQATKVMAWLEEGAKKHREGQ